MDVFFKYRPTTDELKAQLTAELNAALYAGWRHDYYQIKGKKDPLGKNQYKLLKRGFDVGILAGPGTTFIGPSTTTTSITKEYNGMILEYGLAAFLETTFASFGLATGFDHLLNSDSVDLQQEALGRVCYWYRAKLICGNTYCMLIAKLPSSP